MDKTGVSHVLGQMASLLELKGENPFRVRAFQTASRTVAGLSGTLEEALHDGSLAGTRGIGPAILAVVTELANTNRSAAYEELRVGVPPGLVEMLALSGLGVAKVRRIHEHLGIESLADLDAAARSGRLAEVPGFGRKSCENVLRSLAFLHRTSAARLVHHAAREGEQIRAALAQVSGVQRAILAGDLRRRCELVRNLVVVLVADVAPAQLFHHLGDLPGVDEFSGQDERRGTLRFAGGSTAQVVVTPPVNLGAVLVQATGSSRHVSKLAVHAANRGFSLQGAALWQGSTFVPTPDEASLYRALGLPEVPPELRENGALDLPGELPPLVEERDLEGLLHCHTDFSDGTSSIEELARACRHAGYSYLGVTDHSGSAVYAGGLPANAVAGQWSEIDRVNRTVEGMTVLKGVEVDILPDGCLDYPDSVLAGCDFVIASVHDDAGLSRSRMTERLLRAMDNRWVAIIGHPTGRLLLSRDGYPMDLDRVFSAAAERGVALEINADPHRLDLDWRVLPRARELGVTISIGADAHNVSGLDNVHYGIGVARKGGLGPAEVLNTRGAGEFLEFVKGRR